MAHTVHTAAELTELECLLLKHANLHKISKEENWNKLNPSCKLRRLSLWGREYHGTASPSAEGVSKFIPTSWRWCRNCASLSVASLCWIVPLFQKRAGMEQKANQKCRVLHLTFPIILSFSFRTTVRRSVSSSPWAGKGHPWSSENQPSHHEQDWRDIPSVSATIKQKMSQGDHRNRAKNKSLALTACSCLKSQHFTSLLHGSLSARH